MIDGTRMEDAATLSTDEIHEEEELIDVEILNDSAASQDSSVNSVVQCHATEHNYKKISNIYLFSLCWSPVLLLIDMTTDTYLAYLYYLHDEYTYFHMTIAFVLIPLVISSMFSFQMYVRDTECDTYSKRSSGSVLLVFQISPIIRYVVALRHALALRRKNITTEEYEEHSALLLKEDSNLALLRILECFLEAVPQQVLQITILLTPGRPDMPPILQIYLYMSLLFSFVSTAWTLATYHRSIRFAQMDKANMKWISTFVQFLWIFSMMISRILAISVAAAIYPRGTLFVCLLHWCVMTTWLTMFEKTWFCTSPGNPDRNANKSNECLFCAAMGLVYIFSFVAVSDKPTRNRYIFYYSVCSLENLASILVWTLYNGLVFSKIKDPLVLALPTIISVVFVLGIIMMVVYYTHFHPSMYCDADVLSWDNVALSPPVQKKLDVSHVTQTSD